MMRRERVAIVVLAIAWSISGCDGGGMPTTDAGQTSHPDGSMMADAGNMDDDAGNTDDDAGNTDDDAGNTDDDAGNMDDGGLIVADGGTDGGMAATCGDGVVNGVETCDSAIAAGMPGACPTSCNDGLACTTDVLMGSAGSCDAQCATTDITACTAGDSCCPSGCTSDTDADCACVPRTTCMAGECGTVDNGCGGALDCGACLIGGACDTETDCASGICGTEADSAWTGGYCTLGCAVDADCGAGSHCATNDDDGVGFCVANCGSNADCRADYTCRNYDGDVPATNECAPSATGAGAIGDACASVADCAGGDLGFCLTEAQGYEDGFCTRGCLTDTDCVGASHCVLSDPDNPTLGGVCMPECTSGTCARTAGYACSDIDGDASGECAPAATGPGVTGDPCTATFDCAGGPAGGCLPGPDYVDGYCTAGCDTDADCSAGGHCTAFPGDGGTTVNLCTADCSTDAECRAGYACYDRDGNGESECWLAATGTGAVGSACTFIWQCSGDENGACLTEADGFRQGYCTQVCSATMPCPTGSHCGVTDTATGDGICLADCTTGSCRLEGAGYVCSDIDGDTASECFHGGTGVIGSSCAQTWDCTPDWNALCIPEDPSGRFPGGYCTVLCGGTCPTGSTCVGIFTDGSAACLDNCSGTGMGDCRSDYMCTALDSSASVCYDDGT